MMIGFDLRPLEGGSRAVPLPDLEDSGPAAARLFDEACRAITSEHHKRDKAKAETREWMQVVSYDVLRLIMHYHHAQLLEHRIALFGRSKKGTPSGNPFQRGLLAIYADEKGLMDDHDRSYFGKRLWYAYRHYVPTCFLTGFLHQVWSDGAEQRVDLGFIEPDFAEWIIFERYKDEDPELRGEYPNELEANISGLRNVVEPMREIVDRRTRRRAEAAELIDEHFDD